MERKFITPPNFEKVEGITNEAYYYNVAVALAKDLRRAKGEFKHKGNEFLQYSR